MFRSIEAKVAADGENRKFRKALNVDNTRTCMSAHQQKEDDNKNSDFSFATLLASWIPGLKSGSTTELEIIGQRGDWLLSKIAKQLSKRDIGKQIAIHIPTGDYVVDENGWEAFAILRKKHREGDVYKARLTADIFYKDNSASPS